MLGCRRRRRPVAAAGLCAGPAGLGIVFLSSLAMLAAEGGAPGKPAAPDAKASVSARAGIRQALGPFVEKHCVDCHGGERPKAGISFQKIADDSIREETRTWEKALGALRAGKMPPRSRPAPPPADVAAALAWLEAELGDCSGPPDPGRPTIRRLNRSEYNNTIRDLLALTFQPADDFPSDDVGYGFDNIGDVLSIPPLLLEKYLAAAEKIVEKALVVDPITRPVLTRYEADLLKITGPAGPATKKGQMLLPVLLPGAEIRAKPEIGEDGEYVLRVRAAGRRGGGEAVRIVFKVDGKEVKTHDARGGDGVFQVYEWRTRLEPGTRRFQVTLPGAPPPLKDEKPDPKAKKAPTKPAKPATAAKNERHLIVEFLSVEGPMDAKPKPLPESHRRIIGANPVASAGAGAGSGSVSGGGTAPAAADKNPLESARKILSSFARRAWRRPVAREDVDRLLRLVSPGLKGGGNLERAIGPALQAVLASPHFVFKVEVDRGAPGSVSPVSDHELAVRLSYFLWSSMPDEELFSRADAGELRKPGVIDAQVDRMLADPRARALVEDFAGQWLQVRNLKSASPDPGRFPSFDDRLRADMLRETELFFEALVQQNRSVLELIECNFTFLNERLAKHYGIPGVQGEEFRRVLLAGPNRGGVLTQASVLTITSNPTRTSPVKRGKWILEQILGSPPPPPPPGVDDLNDTPEASQASSLRERMELHRKKADCASCHTRMDALGFGLENYDAIGAFREKDGKFPVDASGTLPGGETFRGPGELKAILLRDREAFTRNLTEKMLTFALGRGLEYHDRCTVQEVTRAVMADGFKIRTMIHAIVRSAPFQLRKKASQ